MKCTLCDQRKGKRHCPAKSTLICPQCCGEKRVLEIDCPEDCEYLKMARSRESEEYGRILRRVDPARREAHARVLRGNQETVSHLEFVIARERLSTHDLTDKDVAEAVNLLLGTYRTEDKGIIYERTSDDPKSESVRRALRSVVESRRNARQAGGEGVVDVQENRLTLTSAIECLEFIRDIISCHMEVSGSPTGYVDFVARILPREQRSADERRIIVP